MSYDKKQIPESMMQQVRNYAINMVDYLGTEYVSCCKDLYMELSLVIFTQDHRMDDYNVVANIADWEILEWYERFKREQEEREQHPDESDLKENIDELQPARKSSRVPPPPPPAPSPRS